MEVSFVCLYRSGQGLSGVVVTKVYNYCGEDSVKMVIMMVIWKENGVVVSCNVMVMPVRNWCNDEDRVVVKVVVE